MREIPTEGEVFSTTLYERCLWAALLWLMVSMLGLHLFGAAEAPSALPAPPVPDVGAEALVDTEAASTWIVGLLLIGSTFLACFGYAAAQGLLSAAYPSSVQRHDEVHSASRLPYLEVLLLFVLGGQLVGVGSILPADMSSVFWPLWLSLCLLVVPFWPLRRGKDGSALARALGWHRGTGLLRELGWGILAYIASLPLLAAALGAAFWLAARSDSPPHHPVSDWITSGDESQMVATFVLATLWAPWLEETVFRGAFYHYLRGRLGMIGSALISALVFSALHPQGLAALPFLTTLAFILAWVREWRGSIVASMTMHFIHNSITLLLATVLMG